VTYTAETEGDDVAQIFLEKLEDLRDIWRIKKYKDPADMIFTEEDKHNYDKATKCHVISVEKMDLLKVTKRKTKSEIIVTYSHLLTDLEEQRHAVSNRNYRIPKFIPVIFHNLSNYDAHLFIKKIFIKNPEENLKYIATNEERYITFSNEIVLYDRTDENEEKIPVKREIRFIDSYRFMPSNLDALIKNLNPEQCKNLKKFYSDPSKFDLLKRKGVYPYDYVDSMDKLTETALPPKEAFYSRLNDEETTMKTTNTLKQFGKNLE